MEGLEFLARANLAEVRVHLQQLPGLSLLQETDLVSALRELINREVGAATELQLDFDTSGLATGSDGSRRGTVSVQADFEEDSTASFFVQKLDGLALENVCGFAAAVAARSVDTKQQFHELKAVWESLFFEKNAGVLSMGGAAARDRTRIIEEVMQQLREQKGSSYSTALAFRPDTIVLKNIPLSWVRPPDADACLWDEEGFVPRWRGLHILAHGEGTPHAHAADNLNPCLASMLRAAEVDAPGCLVRWEACVVCDCKASVGAALPTPAKKGKKVKAVATSTTGARCSCSATVYIMYSSYAPFLNAMIMFHTHSIRDATTSRVARPSAHCDAEGTLRTLRGKGLSKRRDAAAERLFRWQALNENKTLQELQDKKAREQATRKKVGERKRKEFEAQAHQELQALATSIDAKVSKEAQLRQRKARESKRTLQRLSEERMMLEERFRGFRQNALDLAKEFKGELGEAPVNFKTLLSSKPMPKPVTAPPPSPAAVFAPPAKFQPPSSVNVFGAAAAKLQPPTLPATPIPAAAAPKKSSRSRSSSRSSRSSSSRSRSRSSRSRSSSRSSRSSRSSSSSRSRSRSRRRRDPRNRFSLQHLRSQGRNPAKGGGGRGSKRGKEIPRGARPGECYDFLEGNCNKGNNCKFKHRDVNDKFRGCYDFQEGNCTYGDTCKYSHEAGHQDPPKDKKKKKKKKSLQPCFGFRRGECTLGDECDFYHEKSAADKEVKQGEKTESAEGVAGEQRIHEQGTGEEAREKSDAHGQSGTPSSQQRRSRSGSPRRGGQQGAGRRGALPTGGREAQITRIRMRADPRRMRGGPRVRGGPREMDYGDEMERQYAARDNDGPPPRGDTSPDPWNGPQDRGDFYRGRRPDMGPGPRFDSPGRGQGPSPRMRGGPRQRSWSPPPEGRMVRDGPNRMVRDGRDHDRRGPDSGDRGRRDRPGEVDFMAQEKERAMQDLANRAQERDRAYGYSNTPNPVLGMHPDRLRMLEESARGGRGEDGPRGGDVRGRGEVRGRGGEEQRRDEEDGRVETGGDTKSSRKKKRRKERSEKRSGEGGDEEDAEAKKKRRKERSEKRNAEGGEKDDAESKKKRRKERSEKKSKEGDGRAVKQNEAEVAAPEAIVRVVRGRGATESRVGMSGVSVKRRRSKSPKDEEAKKKKKSKVKVIKASGL